MPQRTPNDDAMRIASFSLTVYLCQALLIDRSNDNTDKHVGQVLEAATSKLASESHPTKIYIKKFY